MEEWSIKTMLKSEFEAIAGYRVSDADYYGIIEPMYGATDLNKQDFINCLNRKRFEIKVTSPRTIIKTMRGIAQDIFEHCGQRSFSKEEEELDRLARKLAKEQYGVDLSDNRDYIYFNKDYAYYGVPQDRGCTYPRELVIGRGNKEFARITLVEED